MGKKFSTRLAFIFDGLSNELFHSKIRPKQFNGIELGLKKDQLQMQPKADRNNVDFLADPDCPTIAQLEDE